MKPLLPLLILAALPLLVGAALARGNVQTHPFNAADLAMMDRVSDPQL